MIDPNDVDGSLRLIRSLGLIVAVGATVGLTFWLLALADILPLWLSP